MGKAGGPTRRRRRTAGAVRRRSKAQLQTPAVSGIYANWNVNVDGMTGNGDPWDLGTNRQYTILKYGALQSVTER